MTYKPKTLAVTEGGTGLQTLTTAYGVLAAGTTATGNVQTIGAGTSGQVLVSGGAAALPSFQTPPMVLLSTQTASNSSTLFFNNTYITTTYKMYRVMFNQVLAATNGTSFIMSLSTDNGSTFLNSGYSNGAWHIPYNSTTISNTNSTSSCYLSVNAAVANTASISGYVDLVGMNSSVAYGSYYGQSQVPLNGTWYSGTKSGTGVVNYVAFLMASGNITSGSISLYGINQ